MGANYYQAWWAWLADFSVTIVVSLFTFRKSDEELKGLVYGLAKIKSGKEKFFLRPEFLGSLVLLLTLFLNIISW